MIDSEQARARAETFFKSKEDKRAEATSAIEEYKAAQHALQEKTARLRQLRLARDQAGRGKSARPQGRSLHAGKS
jgi:hypothetical protein